MVPSSGALTAFTIDRVSRPATTAAAVAIADRSRRSLRSMATSGGEVCDGATGGVREQHRRTGVVRRVSAALRLRRAPDHSSALAGRLARLGWTRIGSPGIFGERTTKALFMAV